MPKSYLQIFPIFLIMLAFGFPELTIPRVFAPLLAFPPQTTLSTLSRPHRPFKVGAADVLLPGESIGEPCDTLCLESTLRVHVWGITQEEYHYLKALSIYEYNEGDISLTEPVSFPDNVEGGVGIVSIATPGECTVTFRRRYPRYGILYQPVSPDLP